MTSLILSLYYRLYVKAGHGHWAIDHGSVKLS